MDWESLVERLREMFPKTAKSDIELYIESKNPKTTADVEHWVQHYTYRTNRHWS